MPRPKNVVPPPKGQPEKKGKEPLAQKKGNEGTNFLPENLSDLEDSNVKETQVNTKVEIEGRKKFAISETVWSCAKNRLSTKCVIVFCNSSNPKMLDLRGWMGNVWERAGLDIEECRYMGRNFYLVTFVEPDSVTKLLTSKQAMFCKGSPVVTMPWTPNFNVQKAVIDKLPCWVELHDLPVDLAIVAEEAIFPLLGTVMEFENAEPRAFFSSPVCRACVMLDMKATRIYELETEHPDTGEQIVAKVLYKNLPASCFYCGCLDHVVRDCPKKRPRPTPKDASGQIPPNGQGTEKNAWITVGPKGKKGNLVNEDVSSSKRNLNNKFESLAHNPVFESVEEGGKRIVNLEEPQNMVVEETVSQDKKGDGYMYDGDDFIPFTENEEVMLSKDGTPIGRRTRKKINISC